MKTALIHFFMQSLMGVALLPGVIGVSQESEPPVRISLVRPGEGETFYAGPTSLLYNIPIHGWVESDRYRPEEIKVVLAIYQNAELVDTQETHADVNGEYEFYATVNPEGSTENFPATQADCSSYCHYLSELALPAGDMTLELTAIDPGGNQDSVERHIVVDRSDYAYIPLQIILHDSRLSDRTMEGIPVTASTRNYLWRGRNFTASTDGQGRAQIRIEALAESPTHYWVQVEPTIVDGVLYYSDERVEISLPAGATTGPAIALEVKTKSGNITGKIIGMDETSVPSARVLAIRPVDGVFISETVSPEGDFVFDDLPLHEYLIVPDLDSGAHDHEFSPEATRINLVETHSASLEFIRTGFEGVSLMGEIRGQDDDPLPVAWVTNEGLSITQRVMIGSGRFEMHGLPARSGAFIVNAPGYYSRAYSLDLSSVQLQDFAPMLVRRPETKIFPWGEGEIVVPPEGVVESSTSRISFRQGWLWGQNGQASEITIQHEYADILISEGKFVFESLPNRKNWLYLLEGNATIHPSNGMPPVTVHAGEMVTLIQNKRPVPIVIDQEVVAALHMGLDASSQPVWEPTLSARIRDQISRIGVGSVQMITFITYGLILISIVGFPFAALYLRLIKRNKPNTEETDETKR